jgi:hypothetical protein
VGGWINWHFSGFVTTKVSVNFTVVPVPLYAVSARYKTNY